MFQTIEKVLGNLAKKFKFGYYDVDDIKQEGRILAMKALESYDEDRPLENFLTVYLRNRLINLKRDKYAKKTTTCDICPLYDKIKKQCTAFDDKMLCERYRNWLRLSEAKKNLIDSIDIDTIDSDGEKNTHQTIHFEEQIDISELQKYISANISVDCRADYLKMLSNVGVRKSQQAKVPLARQKIVQAEVQRLMDEFYGKQ